MPNQRKNCLCLSRRSAFSCKVVPHSEALFSSLLSGVKLEIGSGKWDIGKQAMAPRVPPSDFAPVCRLSSGR